VAQASSLCLSLRLPEETYLIGKSLAGYGKRGREAVSKLKKCHPELVSGSHTHLILLDAETSSA